MAVFKKLAQKCMGKLKHTLFLLLQWLKLQLVFLEVWTQMCWLYLYSVQLVAMTALHFHTLSITQNLSAVDLTFSLHLLA